jgi:RHS repeat-associated protein
LFDGVNPVQETSGSTVLANILTGLGIDDFLIRFDITAGTTSHFLLDASGSAVALSDSAGAVQTEYTYDPFGRTSITGISNTNSFQFTRRENDGTGLYYYRARYYHPELQRFISEDPIGFGGGDANLYAYVRNNPTNFVDPSGYDREAAGETFQPGLPAGLPGGPKGDTPGLGGIINALNETLGFQAGADFSRELAIELYKYWYRFNCDTTVFVCMNRWHPSGTISIVTGYSGRPATPPLVEIGGPIVCVPAPVRGVNRCCSN